MATEAPTVRGTFTRVPIDSLTPHPLNYRIHDDAVITESITQHGLLGVVVVHGPTGHILAGHGRWTAAKALGHTHIDVHIRDDMSDAEALAYLLADNRTSDLAEYDDALRLALLTDLETANALAGSGYRADEVDALRAQLAPAPVHEARAITCPNCRAIVRPAPTETPA